MNKKMHNLTYPQQSIFLTEQFYKDTNVNNICGTAIIKNTLDFNALKKAINLLVEYNDSFRIHFVKEKTEVKQYVVDYQEFDIEIIDINNEDEIEEIENASIKKTFDIFGENNLFDLKIFRLPNQSGGFVVKVHHIVSDGWTLGLLCRIIMNEYSNLINSIEKPRNILSYINYVEDEEKYINSDKFQKDKEYWNNLFKTLPASAELPSDLSNVNSNLSCIGARQLFYISKRKLKHINEFCSNNKISVFNFLMAIYSIYISKITHLSEFAIGTPILNRTGFAQKNTTGMFINVAPFKISINNEINFTDFAHNIAENSLALLRHQKYPYKLVLEDLRKQDPSIPSLYDIVLSYQLTKANNETDLDYKTRWAFNGTSSDSLTVQFFDLDEEGALSVAYDYKKLKYSSNYIRAMHLRIMKLINKVLENPDISLSHLSAITKSEEYKILNKFNDTNVDYDKNNNVIVEFTKQVNSNPDKTAIICNEKEITYKELNEKSNILAHYLLENGAKAHDIIGIMLNRSIELAVRTFGYSKNWSYISSN